MTDPTNPPRDVSAKPPGRVAEPAKELVSLESARCTLLATNNSNTNMGANKGEIMSKRFALVTAAIVAFAPLLAAPLASAEEDSGQAAFVANKCNMCHSIESLGIERTSSSDKMKAKDLSNVGADHDAAWIVKYVKKEVQLDDADHKKTYKGTEEDLTKIADWLATLKTEG